MIKRRIDRFGNQVEADSALWRKLMTFSLVAGSWEAPTRASLFNLFDTHRVGLGVFKTTFLNVGYILGEYAGKLCAYDTIVENQPEQVRKQNSGYTILLHAKSTSKQYVYIEALECGFTTRFHSCQPNVAFMEMQNGTEVKVLAVMIYDVKAGTELTVNYGDDIWFKCACDECWFGY
ncbi:hypothetical protein PF004_g6171 [Phytophthora fragariae]|uniref:SET domain-containing protein n=1 Tax=Phytophthora fragariae TaxID=53985 RepID=A0A6G0PDU0_9STRA|nr:hypothetical protein PF004_g6171 [Phytophthora fragariae]